MNKRIDPQTDNKSLRGEIKHLEHMNASLSRGIARLRNCVMVITKQRDDAKDSLNTERQRRKDAEANLKKSLRELRDKTGELEKAEKNLADTSAKLTESEKRADELAEKVAKLESREQIESQGNSVPSSQKPTGTKKRHIIVSNPPEGTGQRKRGGQPGHPRATLKGFDKDEATEEETVESPVAPGTVCPNCGEATVVEIDSVEKQVADIKVTHSYKQVYYQQCQCPACKKTFKTPFRKNEEQPVNYGPWVKTELLLNTVKNNMGYEEACEHIAEMTAKKIAPRPSYAAKLIKTNANMLRQSGFADDLRIATICHDLIYWDDTVVSLNGNQGCMRVYTTQDTVFYACHRHKDTIGLDVDGVLQYLDETQRVMHDHNKINYNTRYWYQNLDCVHHFQRKMIFVFCTAGYQCAIDLKMLIGNILHERKGLIEDGKNSFSKETEELYLGEIRNLLEKGRALIEAEGKEETKHYYYNEVLDDFKLGLDHFDQYFGWIRDFSLPADNSLSERLLRPIKSKMKESGCFFSDETGDDFALVRSYIDTCEKNGKTQKQAVYRLCMGMPYSIEELVPTESLADFADLKKEILEAEEEARKEISGSGKQNGGEKAPAKESGQGSDTDEASKGKGGTTKDSTGGPNPEKKDEETEAGDKGEGKDENEPDGDNLVDDSNGAMEHDGHPNDKESERKPEIPEQEHEPGHSQTGLGKTRAEDRDGGSRKPDKGEVDPAGEAVNIDAMDHEAESIKDPSVRGGSDDSSSTTQPRDGSVTGQAPGEPKEDDGSVTIGTSPKGEVDPLDDVADPAEGASDSSMKGVGGNTRSAPQTRGESAMEVVIFGKLWEDMTPGTQKTSRKEEVRRDANGRKMTATQERERAETTRAERIRMGAQMKAQAEIDAKAQASEDAKKDAQRREERRQQVARMRGECEAVGASARGASPRVPKPDRVAAPERQRYMV